MPQLRDINPEKSPVPPGPANPQGAGPINQQEPTSGNIPGRRAVQGQVAVAPAAGPTAGGGFFRRDTCPVFNNFQGDIDLIGNGKVAGVRSCNPGDMSSFQQPKKKAYQEICLAITRPDTTPGKNSVRATAEGLKEASVVITAK